MTDTSEIRELIENWVIWRDAGEWDRLATLWHEDGCMVATWFQASAAEFIARSRAAWNSGMKALHTIGGTSVDVNGARAIAQTKMQIIQRAPVHGVLVDVTCHGRFFDFLEKRGGGWGLVLRQPIYELDYMSPVDPALSVSLDAALLSAFPEGYRHLAYLQTQLGFTVKKSMPGTRGPEIETLNAAGLRWLSGDELPGWNSIEGNQ